LVQAAGLEEIEERDLDLASRLKQSLGETPGVNVLSPHGAGQFFGPGQLCHRWHGACRRGYPVMGAAPYRGPSRGLSPGHPRRPALFQYRGRSGAGGGGGQAHGLKPIVGSGPKRRLLGRSALATSGRCRCGGRTKPRGTLWRTAGTAPRP